MAEADDGDVDDLKAANARELHQTVREEGEGELRRPFAALFWSGLAAGLAINTSLIAEAALHRDLPDAPWRHLVVALGYPMGFLIVILGRMQLFTESTVTAMLPVVTSPSRWAAARTLRLWAIVLGANLVGTMIAAALIDAGMLGDDALRTAALEVSERILELGAWDTFLNAIPAGFLIATLAWLLPNARDQAFWVILAVTYVVAVAGFSHSVVGSDEAFLLLFAGRTGIAQTAFSLIAPAVLGNLVGGAGLFAVLAHAQVRSDADHGEG
ncbi:formate/nitrite transporter family protein [Sphingomonas rubra]|uniref:Formate/nitrite transporter FocA, FNT family n=1 Tax=Sphingomonas rubra TaxID=634430 RepID=A0A1I5SNC8_9SPHN|nr:formate/nitrite transporter family protein [Sphingomonas rubra]SFP72294.1 Formate/nitrite transporter FocA, FNT family [Sphingomonas rubra]